MLDKTKPAAGSVVVPANLSEAAKVHRAIGKELVRLSQRESLLKRLIANLKAKYGGQMDLLKIQILLLAKGAYFYFSEHKSEFTKDKKSYDLPLGGSVEWENSPSAKLEFDDEDALVAQLEKLGLDDCINKKFTVYKNKLKEAIKDDPSLLKKLRKVTVEEGELFRMRFPNTKTQVTCNVSDGELYIYTPRERKQTPASA